jgi:hypothetical protein
MDASKWTEMRRQAATQYINRGGNGAVDASLHTYNTRVKAAAGVAVTQAAQAAIIPNYVPISDIPFNGTGCCYTAAGFTSVSPGTNNYQTNRLNVGTTGSGTRSVTYDAITSRNAGLATCCGPPPATVPPQGIYLPSTCCYLERDPNPSHNPWWQDPAIVQTAPHYANNCCETDPLTGESRSVFNADGTPANMN